MKILVPVDGSPGSHRALKYAMQCVARCTGVELHLLNVQAPMTFGSASRPVARATIEKYRRAEGEKALRNARRALDNARVRYRAQVMSGDIAETIARRAGELHCAEIIMGTRGMGALANLVMGSVAMKVIHLAKVPITLVK